MERKLATIRKVSDIQPIENADNIEVATVDGWKIVVKKGEFEKGDLGVFFKSGSFLPMEERYKRRKFLKKSCYAKMAGDIEGFLVRKVMLRKTCSEALFLPLGLFQEIKEPAELEKDVTELLNVKKYEPPIPPCLSPVDEEGKPSSKGKLPSFLKKTNQEHIQDLPSYKYFETLKEMEFEASEKIDGTSVMYFYNDGEFGVCSRNLEWEEREENTLWQVANRNGIKDSLERLRENIAVQGELVGGGINGNPLELKGHHFYIFDIFDIDKGRYLTPSERYKLIEKMNNDKLKQVPIISRSIQIFKKYDSARKMLEYADGKSALNPNVSREGLVFKSCELYECNTVSFRVKMTKRWLLYAGDKSYDSKFKLKGILDRAEGRADYVSALNELCQQEGFPAPDYKYQFDSDEKVHTCTCTVAERSNDLVSKESENKKKQDAKKTAAKLVFESLRKKVSSDDEQKLKEILDRLEKTADLQKTPDYVSALNQLCAKIGFPEPKYTYDSRGPSHAQIHTCTCTVAEHSSSSSSLARKSAKGRSKKEAQQAAAEVVFQSLGGNLSRNGERADYVSALNELCKQEGFPEPKYEYKFDSEGQFYTCACAVAEWSNSSASEKAKGKSKREAQQAAAKFVFALLRSAVHKMLYG